MSTVHSAVSHTMDGSSSTFPAPEYPSGYETGATLCMVAIFNNKTRSIANVVTNDGIPGTLWTENVVLESTTYRFEFWWHVATEPADPTGSTVTIFFDAAGSSGQIFIFQIDGQTAPEFGPSDAGVLGSVGVTTCPSLLLDRDAIVIGAIRTATAHAGATWQSPLAALGTSANILGGAGPSGAGTITPTCNFTADESGEGASFSLYDGAGGPPLPSMSPGLPCWVDGTWVSSWALGTWPTEGVIETVETCTPYIWLV